MKLLAIGVPSFNDAAMLRETLTNLTPLIGHPELEILVSDNSSPDSSSEVLREFETQVAGSFQFFVQSANLGFRGNLGFLATKSSAKYIWFLGIGERIETGAINDLLDVLRQIEPTNMVVSGIVSSRLPTPPARLVVSESRSDATTPLYSETISLNILKRAPAAEALGRNANSSGDFWPHLEVILESVAAEGRAANTVFFSDAIVAIAPNSDGWWFDRSEAYTLTLAQIRILRDALNGSINSNWLKKRLNRMRSIGLGEIVLRSRKNGRTFTKEELRLIQSEADLNLVQRGLLLVAHLTPLKAFQVFSPLARFF